MNQFGMAALNSAGAAASVSVIGFPLDANLNKSPASLSQQQYSSSDPTIFSVTPDPNTPGGAIITCVATPAAGQSVSATLTENATATEPDGTTTEQITGSITIVLNGPGAPPPPPPAASIGFTFGTPQ